MSQTYRLARANNSQGRPGLPIELPGLVAWGEGADLGSDGTAIASWLNKTGSGLDAAQASSGNRPTVKANAINGQTAASFDGSTSYLSFGGAALDWIRNVSGWTMMAVVQPAALAGSGRVLWHQVGTGTSARAALFSSTTSLRSAARALDTDSGLTTTATSALTVGVPAIIGASASLSGQVVTTYLNGAAVATASGAGVTAGNSSDTAALAAQIGADSNAGASPANFWSGYIAAYAMWAASYSRLQLDPVLRRWSRLYGVAIA